VLVGSALVTVFLAGCAGAQRAATTKPSPSDVTAARLCEAFAVYVNDARNNSPNRGASQALDQAEQNLKSNHGSRSKWGSIANDIDAFMNDISNANGQDIQNAGVKVGEDCLQIPAQARRAGGFI
jgi:hypothetical protein